MGLDIRAYRNLVKVSDCEGIDKNGEVDNDRGYIYLYVSTDFPERADGLKTGVYKKEDYTLHFRAGSYGTYNMWRKKLTVLAGFKSDKDLWMEKGGPFWELIFFTDCDGVIGPVTSAKLAKDFEDYHERADQTEDKYFIEKYNMFRNAFEIASRNGAVEFC